MGATSSSSRTPTTSRRTTTTRFSERLRARPRRQHDHAGQPAGRAREERGRTTTRSTPTISGDGNRVAFSSGANNLSNEDDDAEQNIFVRDLETATNALVSRASGAGGAPGNGESDERGHLVLRSLRRVQVGRRQPLRRGRQQRGRNIFVRDLDQSTTALASRASGPGGAGADDKLVPIRSSRTTLAWPSNRPGEQPVGRGRQRRSNNVFVRDVLADTTELVSRAPGPAGAAANDSSFAPDDLGRRALRGLRVAGNQPVWRERSRASTTSIAATSSATRRGPRPLCKTLPLPPAPPDKDDVIFTLTVSQLRINQRISQAAIRRLNAVEARLDGGLQTRDLCGYSVGPPQLGPGITSAPAAASLAPAAPADPAAIVDPGRSGPGDPLTLSAAQLLINQRIDQAAIRRATGITNRLEAGLTRRRRAAPARSPRASSSTASRSSPRSLRPSRPPARPRSRRARTRPTRAASPSPPPSCGSTSASPRPGCATPTR